MTKSKSTSRLDNVPECYHFLHGILSVSSSHPRLDLTKRLHQYAKTIPAVTAGTVGSEPSERPSREIQNRCIDIRTPRHAPYHRRRARSALLLQRMLEGQAERQVRDPCAHLGPTPPPSMLPGFGGHS